MCKERGKNLESVSGSLWGFFEAGLHKTKACWRAHTHTRTSNLCPCKINKASHLYWASKILRQKIMHYYIPVFFQLTSSALGRILPVKHKELLICIWFSFCPDSTSFKWRVSLVTCRASCIIEWDTDELLFFPIRFNKMLCVAPMCTIFSLIIVTCFFAAHYLQ